jgi:hypothetical protein
MYCIISLLVCFAYYTMLSIKLCNSTGRNMYRRLTEMESRRTEDRVSADSEILAFVDEPKESTRRTSCLRSESRTPRPWPLIGVRVILESSHGCQRCGRQIKTVRISVETMKNCDWEAEMVTGELHKETGYLQVIHVAAGDRINSRTQ